MKIRKKRKQIKILRIINYLVDQNNDNYIRKESEKVIYEKIEYDINQKQAIYSDEKINLVIAGAGSGKTSTIVGKIEYLIKYKNISPRQIICFSFTNEAVTNLSNRLSYPVKVCTFHKFSLEVVSKKYNIDNNKLEYVIDEYFNGVIIDHKEMIKKVIKCLNKKNYRNYNSYLQSKELYYLKRQIKEFIDIFKSYGYEYNKFLKIKSKRFKNILSIIIDVYTLYLSELASTNSIDLDMLIIKATEEIKKHKFNYKYIIIDEFQDISNIRVNLINALMDSSDAKIMAVGDDYQSIYNFSGSDMSILLNICKMNETKVIYLKNNYRCCQEIVNISNTFILKNKSQIKKEINAYKNINCPIVIVREKKNILEKLLRFLEKENKDIMILGRNNNDIKEYLNRGIFYKDSKLTLSGSFNNIYYKTVHSAKGLEADIVIIINLIDSLTGFPSQIRNSDLTKHLKFNEKYKFAEERRLFYVALTRSKGKIYLLSKDNQSCFLKEIIKDNKKNITYLDL